MLRTWNMTAARLPGIEDGAMPPRRSSNPPPPHHGPPHHGAPHHGPRSVPPARRSSAGLASLAGTAEIAALLAPLVPDEEDREFVARCIAPVGPSHHRVASFALLRLLSEALAAAGGPLPAPQDDEGIPVPFRLPPHLDRHADEDAHYPIRLPRRALDRLAPAGSREAETYADALTDGPAHHALANVAMASMLDALIARLSRKGGA